MPLDRFPILPLLLASVLACGASGQSQSGKYQFLNKHSLVLNTETGEICRGVAAVALDDEKPYPICPEVRRQAVKEGAAEYVKEMKGLLDEPLKDGAPRTIADKIQTLKVGIDVLSKTIDGEKKLRVDEREKGKLVDDCAIAVDESMEAAKAEEQKMLAELVLKERQKDVRPKKQTP
jgi:hypothetical protein